MRFKFKYGDKDGKIGLINALKREAAKYLETNKLSSETSISYLQFIMKDIAVKAKILPDSLDMKEEMNHLMQRSDFELGKDYSFLYKDEARMPQKEEAKVAGKGR